MENQKLLRQFSQKLVRQSQNVSVFARIASLTSDLFVSFTSDFSQEE